MPDDAVYAILTNRGAELEAAAVATGIPVILNKFAIGDANGAASVVPDPAQTSLIREVYRGDIQNVEVDANNIIFHLYIPPETGGYTIKEVGIYTSEGELYSIARPPDIIKPQVTNGAVVSVTLNYTLVVSSTSAIIVVVYDEYLTPGKADQRYLRVSEDLSEIRQKGGDHPENARKNLGIDGDIAYRDKNNEFTQINNFKKDILFSGEQNYLKWPASQFNACGLLYGSGLSGGAGAFFYPSSEFQIYSSYRVVLRVNDYNSAYVRDSQDNYYKIWNAGNLNPVRKVNDVSPDSSGNVTIDVTNGSVRDIRLGAQVTIPKEGDHDQLYACPAGCVVTAIDVSDGGGREAAVSTVSYKPVQKLIGDQWVTILG